MNYQSTRNHRLQASSAAAVLEGIAADGGLYIRDDLSTMNFDWEGLLGEDSLTMSARILSALLPDIPDMETLVKQGYEGKFETDELTPLAQVGDRYVVERMRADGYNLGGEQSGHLILGEHSTTGDGLVAALQVCAAVVAEKAPTSHVMHLFEPMPQLLKNVRLADRSLAAAALDSDTLRVLIAGVEKELGTDGRLLIRASGTEPLIRIMLEGEDRNRIAGMADKIAAALEDEVKGLHAQN